MRSSLFAAVLLLVGCGGAGPGSGAGGSGPGIAVMPNLTELPGDLGKRDAVLDQANARPGPEHSRQNLSSPKARRAETYAATAAAILGDLFSTTHNVVFGTGGSFDENAILDGKPQPVPRAATDADGKDRPAGQLVPWVKLPANDGAAGSGAVKPHE